MELNSILSKTTRGDNDMTTKMTNKTCSKCKQEQNISEFYRPNRSWCKSCDSKASRYRMGRYENKIRIAMRDSKKTAEHFGVYDDLTYDDVAYTFAIAGKWCAYCGRLSNE